MASQLQLEVESRDLAETESRDLAENESRDEAKAEVEVEAPSKKLWIRGEAGVPDEDKEPTTEEGKALIHPNDVE